MHVGHAHLTNVVVIIIYRLRFFIAEAEWILPESLLRVAHFCENDYHFRNKTGNHFYACTSSIQEAMAVFSLPAPIVMRKDIMNTVSR